MNSKQDSDSQVLGRREFLSGVGVLGLGSLAMGDPRSLVEPAGFSPKEVAAVLRRTCVLTPSESEGPFYRAFNLQRRDITEGQPGLPTVLYVRVVRASDCTPIQGAVVDVWQAEHLGTYSGYQGQGTFGQTWLRGVQITGANGLVRFDTVFPGWYPGRVPHLHMKVFPTMTTELTTQTYFPNSLSDEVFKLPPYDVRGPKPHTNQDDMYFHRETVFSVVKAGRAQIYPTIFRPRIERLLGGLTIAVV
jgi:protocatechuate 3,4-dioxygenase beta subunit